MVLKDGVDILCSPSFGLKRAERFIDDLVGKTADGDGATRAQIAQIESVLEQADALRRQERWQDAITYYLQAEQMILRVTTVIPKVPQVPPTVLWPRSPQIFNALLQAGLALVDRLSPEPTIAPPVGPVDPNVLGDGPALLRELGITHVTAVSSDVKQWMLAAERNFGDGHYALAAEQYKQALNLLDAAHLDPARTPDAVRVRADVALNLGTSLSLVSRDGDAMTAFARATTDFTAIKDTLGAGQAAHNVGVLQARGGRLAEAKASLATATKLLDQAHGSLARGRKVLAEINKERAAAPPSAAPAAVAVTPAVPAEPELEARHPVIGLAAHNLVRLATSTEMTRAMSVNADTRRMIEDLDGSTSATELSLFYRDAVVSSGFSAAALPSDIRGAFAVKSKQLTSLVGDTPVRVSWNADGPLPTQMVLQRYYEVRLAADSLAKLRWSLITPPDTAVYLAHLYAFVIPMGLGDCYYGLGSFAKARTSYLSAADYQYINSTIEVPTVWRKIAQTVLSEGDQQYKADQPQLALTAYGGVLKPDSTAAANQPLFTHPKLKPIGDLVVALLANPSGPIPAALGAGVAAVVLDIRMRITQIAAGLDWLGLPASIVPPFTFDYLQNAARYMAQQAIQNEREFVQFREKYDTSSLTRLQLVQAAELAKAEQEMYRLQKVAAQQEVAAAQAAVDTATVRRNNAAAARAAYVGMSAERNWLEANIAWYSSQNEWELNNNVPGTGKDIHQIVSEDRQRIGDITREYELARMQDQINELDAAKAQAQAQKQLSQARLDSAQQAENVAKLRAQQAAAVRDAFDDQFFTPEVWFEMAQFMRQQANRYLHWATRIARLMQAAYRFENDSDVNKIRTDYLAGVTKGLLGGDQLLSDIDYFTFHHLTTTKTRDIRAKSIVSLADRFPFELQTGLRAKGTVSFETLLGDLERQYPGTHNHRISDIEVQVIGMTPAGGFRGFLTNSGISQYRRIDGAVAWRVQPKETLAITAYSANDLPRYRHHDELLGVFEGAGLASSWTLTNPPDVNDVDFRFVVDVQIIFYYTCRYSPTLAAQLAAQPVPAAALRASRVFSSRWDFPDRFFLVAETGTLDLPLEPADVPFTQLSPKIRTVAVQLLPAEGHTVANLGFELTSPGGVTSAVTANAQGLVPSNTAALAPMTGGSLLGNWRVKFGGTPEDRAVIRDVLVFVEYDFSRRVLA